MTKPSMPSTQIALITGSSRGLGRTLAEFLAVQGYGLILTARHEDALNETADALKKYGHLVYTLAGDVTDEAHRRELARVAGEAGGLDLLVNNASDLGASPLPELVHYPLAALRQVFETNVLAPLALVQENLESLKKRGGLVVNISSDAAVGGYEGWGGYGSSKAALDLLTRTLAAELQKAGRGVNVVAVDPGDLRTQMHQDAFPGEDISDRPLPEVTLPFWAWLLGQDPKDVSGTRFGAQAERWEVPRKEGSHDAHTDAA